MDAPCEAAASTSRVDRARYGSSHPARVTTVCLSRALLNDHGLHASPNVVADDPNPFNGLTLRVVHGQSSRRNAGHVRTLVAAYG
jgi:hypothetical protein